jgi:superfamily II DNA or RNA helicase
VNTDDKNNAAIQEALEQGHDRNCWLAFCAGVDHADAVAGLLNSYGVPAAAVHSKLSAGERDARIAAFKSGELRCITNNNILTTGFDHPPVDMILMLRPTMSTVLWIQMLGRGTRPYDANDPSQYILVLITLNAIAWYSILLAILCALALLTILVFRRNLVKKMRQAICR